MLMTCSLLCISLVSFLILSQDLTILGDNLDIRVFMGSGVFNLKAYNKR